jgi:hypothetical protein
VCGEDGEEVRLAQPLAHRLTSPRLVNSPAQGTAPALSLIYSLRCCQVWTILQSTIHTMTLQAASPYYPVTRHSWLTNCVCPAPET